LYSQPPKTSLCSPASCLRLIKCSRGGYKPATAFISLAYHFAPKPDGGASLDLLVSDVDEFEELYLTGMAVPDCGGGAGDGDQPALALSRTSCDVEGDGLSIAVGKRAPPPPSRCTTI
jgi:hypothetical protein